MALATLTVDLVAKLAKFEADLGRATHMLEKSTARWNAMLGSLGVGVSAGGFVLFVKGLIDSADSINDLSQKISTNIADLATWQLAAEQSGTTLDVIGKGAHKLSVYMVENSDKLKRAGITAKDVNGAFLQLADLFKSMPEGAEQSALASTIFGDRMGADMIPVLRLGSEKLGELRDKSVAYAEALAKLAPKADEFNDQLAEIVVNLRAGAMNGLAPYMDGLISMASLMNEATRSADGLKKMLDKLADVTGSGSMSVFSALSKGVDAYYLFGGGGDPAKRSASGKIGAPKMALPGANTPEEAAALARAMGLINKHQKQAETDGQRLLKTLQERLVKEQTLTETQQLQARIAQGLIKFDNQRQKDAALTLAGRIDAEKDWEAAVKSATEEAIKANDEWIKTNEANANRLKTLLSSTALGQFDAFNADVGFAERMFNAPGSKMTQDQLDAITSSLFDVEKAGKDTFDELGRAIDGWGKSAASAFVDFALTGKGSFSDLVAHMLREAATMMVYESIFSPLFSAFGRSIKTGLPAFGGGRASGGPVYPGQYYVVGENGPEVLVPNSSGRVIPAGVSAAGGGSNVQVNIIEAPGQGGKTQQRNQGGVNILDVFVERIKAGIAGDIADGRGAIPAAMSNAYGLNRAAGGF